MTAPFADDQLVLILDEDQNPSPATVRQWLYGTLAGVPLVPRLRVALVVDELVANARRWAPAPYVLSLELDHGQRVLRVCVGDCGVDLGGTWTGGTGLALVDGLALAWGVEHGTRSKTVWAEVALGVSDGGLRVLPPPPNSRPRWP